MRGILRDNLEWGMQRDNLAGWGMVCGDGRDDLVVLAWALIGAMADILLYTILNWVKGALAMVCAMTKHLPEIFSIMTVQELTKTLYIYIFFSLQ